MKLRTLALATSGLVAIAAIANTATAAGAFMGKVNLGVGYAWEDFSADGDSWSNDYPAIHGAGAVNIPYNDVVNLQVDIFGAASMDNYGPDPPNIELSPGP